MRVFRIPSLPAALPFGLKGLNVSVRKPSLALEITQAGGMPILLQCEMPRSVPVNHANLTANARDLPDKPADERARTASSNRKQLAQ